MDKNKMKTELFKLVSFTLTGIVSAAADCAVYYLLVHFTKINFRFVQPISMTVGLLCSFVVNRFIVFKKEKRRLGVETVKYVCVCIVCVTASPAIISLYAGWLGKDIGKIPATLTTGLLNYLLCRFFVYGGGSSKGTENSEIL